MLLISVPFTCTVSTSDDDGIGGISQHLATRAMSLCIMNPLLLGTLVQFSWHRKHSRREWKSGGTAGVCPEGKGWLIAKCENRATPLC